MRDVVKTRYPFPPDDIYRAFPEAVPWDTPISELVPFWLHIECTCGAGDSLYPLRLMSANIGWKVPLRSAVPRLRCKSCGGRPVRVSLVQRSDGDGQTTARGREYVLVNRA